MARYSPQSATVTGILKDMYDTFAADLEKSNQDESNAQKGFEEVIEEKTKKNKILQGMVTDKSAPGGAKEGGEREGGLVGWAHEFCNSGCS